MTTVCGRICMHETHKSRASPAGAEVAASDDVQHGRVLAQIALAHECREALLCDPGSVVG